MPEPEKEKEHSVPEREEDILAFWEQARIFERSLAQTEGGKPFTFYDGPPFATGLPHYGHILSSTIKDVIARYQTMRGRYVRRRWGWDCHGLPVEEIVERALGISGKKKIEEIGIGKFNDACRRTVLQYVGEWRKMVRRIGRWVEFDDSYKTMDRDYMESVWWAFKQMYEKGLVYEGRKVLLYCPRCETPVSNFEVAMDNSYKDVTEDAVTVKFKVRNPEKINLQNQNVYLLAWTTTPWTLPGNVALAINKETKYRAVQRGNEYFIAAVNRLKDLGLEDQNIANEYTKADLTRLDYEPLFKDVLLPSSDKTFKVYAADFVTTDEGTGIVHTAVVYGEDDYNLGVKEGLPVVPLLDEKGVFNDKAPELVRGKYFKKADKLVIADLEARGLLFEKKTHTHSYPHCWRCDTALFYNAIPAWFVNVQKIKKALLKSNEKEISWFPEHLKFGRYAKSVEQAPDWNISRNRYWGNPIPVWKCANAAERACPPLVLGSIRELGLERNTFWFARHGEAESNVRDICSPYQEPDPVDLTPLGIRQAEALAKRLKKEGIDLIVASDVRRTKHTAEIAAGILKCPVEYDARLREWDVGVWGGKPAREFEDAFPMERRWREAPEGGESLAAVGERTVAAMKDLDRKHRGKKILVVSHEDPLWLLGRHFGAERGRPEFAEPFTMNVSVEDLHRPGIDEVVLQCPHCGGEARRVKEIFDSWVEAGSMPFAELHYPFEQDELFKKRVPAQFVAEYIAQTRAWFYVMHVISLVLFGRAPFENVVTTGTILAEDGSKMSKSKHNFPDPWDVIRRYGVDALRFYLMGSVVMQADNLNFSARELETAYRNVLLILWNSYRYFRTYAKEAGWRAAKSGSVELTALDRWVNARTQETVNGVTECFDRFDTAHAARLITDYVSDLSTWYIRRSRGRKDSAFFATLYGSLATTSKLVAPLMPFVSESIYRGLIVEFGGMDGEPESVHLAAWPAAAKLGAADRKLLADMAAVREIASKALALRKSQHIALKQPLRALKLATYGLPLAGELTHILKDEVNVKEVEVDAKLGADMMLDAALTDELRLEGLTRGLERLIQDLRKKKGLNVGEQAALRYATEDADLARALRAVNMQKTYLSGIEEAAGAEGLEPFALGEGEISLGVF